MTKCPVVGKDRIAELYPHVNEEDMPLPRSWSTQDRCTHIGLSQNNLRAHYKGSGKSPKDAAAVRTRCSIPSACGLYYFEIKVISKGRDGYIGIGLCTQNVNLSKLPGWEKESYGYHADDGHCFFNSNVGDSYGPTFTTGDTVGCGLNLINRTCFYTKNGIDLGIAFKDMVSKLHPTVGLQTPGEIVDVNFGQQPFVFDIEAKRQELRGQIIENIENFNAEPNIEGNWQTLLQRIVSGYLVHHGYSSTADCFAKATGQSISEELSSVRNRQRILKLILSGRISEAIDTTQNLYPGLFDRNKKLYFQLKCRQFIEMINGCDGEIKTYAHSPTRSTKNSPCASPSRSLSRQTSNSGLSSNSNINSSKFSSSTSSATDTGNISHSNNDWNRTHNGSSAENGFDNNSAGNGYVNHADGTDNEMIVDGFVGNGVCVAESKDSLGEEDVMDTGDHQASNQRSDLSGMSVITNSSKGTVDTSPSFRQLCGGNIMAIEKLITFGKALQSTYKELVKDIGPSDENETLMKEAFSLLAYSNPRDSPVSSLLEPSQREGLCAALNAAILEAHNLPGQPALEVALAQTKACLRTMPKYDLAACALVQVEDFFC